MFEEQTFEKILNRMLSRVQADIDKREGSIIYDALAPAAAELAQLYIEISNTIKESYADTASREYLILRCKERGISPKPATKAKLECIVTPDSLDVLGKRFNLQNLNYVIKEKIDSGKYLAECETSGEVGNRYFGNLIPVEYIPGLQSAILSKVLIYAEEEESTEKLRERYFSSLRTQPFGGNKRDYTEKVLNISGVGAVKVVPWWKGGVNPSTLIPTKEVDTWAEYGKESSEARDWLLNVYRQAKSGNLTFGGGVQLVLLDASFNVADSFLVNTVQSFIDPVESQGVGMGLAPIGHRVSVISAKAEPISVTTRLLYKTEYSFETLKNEIQKVVEQYFTDLRKDWSSKEVLIIRISQLEARILDIQGVVDIQEVLLNGKNVNLTIASDKVPILQEIME